MRSIAPAILWLSFSSGQVIGTTIGHEVWTEQDGWTSAGHLEIGDTLLDQGGNAVVVTDLRLDPTPTIVYNLEVEGAHAYFVGLNDCGDFALLVHNQCIGHQLVPRAVLKRLSPGVANHPLVRGRPGHPNIWEIPETLHKRHHSGGGRGGQWNDAWWRELGGKEGAKNATVETVLAIREKLIKQFGLEMYKP